MEKHRSYSNKLKINFSNKNNHSQIYQLKREKTQISQETKDIPINQAYKIQI
jgi:hypothetical protein